MKILKLSEIDDDFQFGVRVEMQEKKKRFLYGQPHASVRRGQFITTTYALGDTIGEAIDNFYSGGWLGELYYGVLLIENDL